MKIVNALPAPWRAEAGFDPLTYIADNGTPLVRNTATGRMYNAVTLEPIPRKCQPIIAGDQTYCGACGLAWDTNDPDEPDCPGRLNPSESGPWLSGLFALVLLLFGFLVGYSVGDWSWF